MALLDNLAAHWTLNEASGTRNDSHGASHLSDNNTVLSAPGKIGDAADFERTNSEWLSCASNAALQSGDVEFYLAFWFNAESLPGDMGLISKWTTGTGFEYLVEWDASTFYWWYGSSVFASKAYTTTGAWTFCECYHDPTANQIGIALNGGSFTTAAITGGNTAGTSPFEIGRYNLGRYFDGLIDNVWLWKRLLTAPERAEIYNGGAGLDYPASAVKTSWWAWNQFAGKA